MTAFGRPQFAACVLIALAGVTACGSSSEKGDAAATTTLARQIASTPQVVAIEPSTAQYTPSSASPIAVPITGPSAAVVTEIPIGVEAGGLLAAPEYVWSLPHLTAVAQHIDPATNQVDTQVSLTTYSGGEVLLDDGIVVVQAKGDQSGPAQSELRKLDLATGEQLASVTLPRELDLFAQVGGSLWANGFDGVLTQLDPANMQVEGLYQVFDGIFSLSAGADALWMIDDHEKVVRLDPSTMTFTDESSILEVVPAALRDSYGQLPPAFLTGVGDSLALNTGSAVHFIDAQSGAATGAITPAPGSAFQTWGMPTSRAGVWLTMATLVDGRFPNVARGEPSPPVRLVLVDPSTSSVVSTIDTSFPERIATAGEDLWWSVLREPRVIHATFGR